MAVEPQTSSADGNSGPSSPPAAAELDGRNICWHYMVKFCPYDLLHNTKCDFGPCKLLHDPLLKQSFERNHRYAVDASDHEDRLAMLCENLVKLFDKEVEVWRGKLNEAINKELKTENNKLTMHPMKMDLCKTCGSFLIADDVIERTRAHETEKQHIVFDLIRDFIAKYVDGKRKREEKDMLLKKIQRRRESWNMDRKRKRTSSN